jgi:hypothetical protein
MPKTFKVPHFYVTEVGNQSINQSIKHKLTQVIQNHESASVHNIGEGETRHRKCERLNFSGGKACETSRD